LFQLRSCCILVFFFLARDAPASSSCDTDDGGFNPLLLFCVLLQNYLACLIFLLLRWTFLLLVSSCSSESLWQQKAVFNLVWQKEGFDDAPFCEEYQASCLVLFSFPVT
jgi:hypothetical protein